MNKSRHLTILIIFIILAIYGIAVHPTYPTPYLTIVTAIISYFGLSYSSNRIYMGSMLLTIYYIIVAPLQYCLSYIQPYSIISANYNKYYDSWMFADTQLMVMYFLYATLFYIIGLFTIQFVERCVINTHRTIYNSSGFGANDDSKRIDIVLVRFPLLWLLLSSIADYSFRQNTINGILSYFLYGWSVFNLANVVINNSGERIKWKNAVKILLGLIIYSIPGILAGRRMYVVSGIFISLLYLLSVNRDQIQEVLKRRKVIVIILVGLFFVFFGLTNLSKFGVFNPLGLFVSRITGLFDGSSILDYQRSNHVNLGIGNYIITAYNDSGVRANKYYTKTIIGYPSWAATSSAAPIFISSLLYGNIGFLCSTLFFTAIFGFVTKKASVAWRGLSSDRVGTYIKYKSFICADAVYVVFVSYFLDGNIEIIKNLVTPIVAWCLFLGFWVLQTGGRRING